MNNPPTRTIAAVALLILSTSSSSKAEDAVVRSAEAAIYGKALLQCYGSDGDKLACMGRTVEACMAREADGQTTIGAIKCLSAETETWDGKLNDEYTATRSFYAAMDHEDSGQRVDELLKAQRAWITFRDAECTMEYAAWGAGSIRSIAGADCLMSITAERTVRLAKLRELME